jgi:hypothetical protein
MDENDEIDADAPDGVYIYCLLRCQQTPHIRSRAIGTGGPVYLIQHQDMAAVVSDSPIVEYDGTRRNMMAHTVVLEEVLKEHTILPVRFGVIAPDAEVVRAQLQRRYEELGALLDTLDGRIELGLKVLWQENAIYHEVVAASPTIRALRDKMLGRSPEESYYDRIRLGELTEAAIVRRRQHDADLVMERLEPLCQQVRRNDLITERMVLNAAFLLDREQESAFEQAVEQLDTDLDGRLLFKYVGPVPPYNFVNLVLHWG